MSVWLNSENPKVGEYTTTLHINKGLYVVHVEILRNGMQGYVIHEGQFFCTLPWAGSRTELLSAASKRIRDAQ